MRHRLIVLVLAAVLVLSPLPLAAGSAPSGSIAGIELCPLSVCGAAIFAGNAIVQLTSSTVNGVFWAAIDHDPLDTTALITGGTFLIRTKHRIFAGVVLQGGTLTNNGNNTYTVNLTMQFTKGSHGTASFTGLLDHRVFPPTIVGNYTAI